MQYQQLSIIKRMNYDILPKEELLRLLQERDEELLASKKEVERLNGDKKHLSFSFDQAPIACITLTPEGVITSANKCVCSILYMDLDKIIGSNLHDLLPKYRSDSLRDIIAGLGLENRTYHFYTHHLSENGILRAYLWFSIGSFGDDGNLNYITSYCYPEKLQDEIANQIIYLQEKAQNDVLTSQRLMSSVLEMIQENNTLRIRSILRLINEHYDADTCCYLSFHEEISKMCLRETVLSETSTIILPNGFQVSTIPEFIDRYKEGYTRIGYFGEEELLCDLFNYIVDHKMPYTASMSVPILSGDKLWGVLIVIRQRNNQRWTDPELSLAKLFTKVMAISLERLSIQADLKRHQMLVSLALEKSEVYTWQYDPLAERFFNCELLLQRFGTPAELQPAFTTKTFYKIMHPDDVLNFHNCLVSTVRQCKEDSIQVRVRTNVSEGSAYEWFEFRFIPVTDEATGEVVELIGTSSCIDRYKQAEQHLIDLLEAKHQADESNLMKTAFIANMSHEIRTPLNAIIGFSELLMDAEMEKEEKDKYMKIIHDNNRILLQLINDILDMSRIESGHIEPVYEEVNLRELLQEFAQLSNMNLLGKGLTLELEKDLKDCVMKIERRTVTQVMTNFINNAIKFTTQGSIVLGYRVSPDGNGMTYYVRDTGCGIPKEDCSRIFQRFVKLNDFAQGTGLGLSISEMLVKKQNGSIGVFSEKGKGSEFWFTLPFCN